MNCKNCGNTLHEYNSYCSTCGARVIRNRLTMRNLFDHISEEYFDYDNKFFKTILHLFTKPEAVIGGYIDGTRKKYVNVINYFAIAISVAGLQLFIMNKFFPEYMDAANYADLFGPAGSELQKSQLEAQNTMMSFIQEYQSLVMMLYIPIYALMSKLIFFNIKKYNYTEHLVIFMYLQAQYTLCAAVLMIIAAIINSNSFMVMSILSIPLMIAYNAFCFKRLYNLSMERIITKTLIFILVLGGLFIIISILSGIILFLTGGFDEMIKETQQNSTALSYLFSHKLDFV